ncbi:hypothetical protein F5Y18DRAFT_201267 [Xylariaceae sp. FL1019]|nr:hypothetical protein F5Y18DRAFT_201267 [Xylariaceae sp. FL1019]
MTVICLQRQSDAHVVHLPQLSPHRLQRVRGACGRGAMHSTYWTCARLTGGSGKPFMHPRSSSVAFPLARTPTWNCLARFGWLWLALRPPTGPCIGACRPPCTMQASPPASQPPLESSRPANEELQESCASRHLQLPSLVTISRSEVIMSCVARVFSSFPFSLLAIFSVNKLPTTCWNASSRASATSVRSIPKLLIGARGRS